MKRMLGSIGLGLLLAAPARGVDITACGQLVPAGAVGVLQNDLDCGGEDAAAHCGDPASVACAQDPACTDTGCGGIALRAGSTLQMNGHTVANGVVICLLKSCAVVGPGVVDGGYGVGSIGKGTFTVSGVDVHGGEGGISSFKGPLVLQDVTVSDIPTYWGIQAFSRLRLTNVSVTGCKVGIRAECPLKGSNVTTNDNGQAGIFSTRAVHLIGLTATGNGATSGGHGGIYEGGIYAPTGSVHLTESVVTGNLVDGVPLDLNTARRPRLVDTTCDHSGYRGTGVLPPWGVCRQD